MKLTDPHFLLDAIDLKRWDSLRAISDSPAAKQAGLVYVEPSGSPETSVDERKQVEKITSLSENEQTTKQGSTTGGNILKGKVNRLGDFIDTDAVSVPFMLLA
jgi:hypothetical protein